MKTIKNKPLRGFTLIELLVVIAIIGILASIILASLATARSKGSDAKVEEELANMRSQAELYNYTGTLTAVPGGSTCAVPASGTHNMFETGSNGLGTILTDLLGISNIVIKCAAVATKLPSAGGQWMVLATLSNYSATTPANNDIWCVDSTGASRSSTAAGVAYTTLASAGNGTVACN